jgi:transposase
MDDLDFEVDLFAGIIRGRMAKEPGYTAVHKIPGIGPTLGAVLIAEIGDVTRFASAAKLTCWAGLTPKHHEFDTHVHRGRITKQGSRLVSWAAIESVKTVPITSPVGVLREWVADRRCRRIGSVAAARLQLHLACDIAFSPGVVPAARAALEGGARSCATCRW